MIKKFVIKTIWIYKKFLSPLLGNHCRFYPSCSDYTKLAIEKYGLVKGIIKCFIRILRCNPFNTGGVDYP